LSWDTTDGMYLLVKTDLNMVLCIPVKTFIGVF